MSNMIKHIDYFPAGYCSSHSGLLFKGIPNEKMQFPAGVFLIHHREKGYILYDTGYHYEIKKKSSIFLVPSSHTNADEKGRPDRLFIARAWD